MLELLFWKVLEVSAVVAVTAAVYYAFRPVIRKHFGADAEYKLLLLIMLRAVIPFHHALTLPALPLPEPVEAPLAPEISAPVLEWAELPDVTYPLIDNQYIPPDVIQAPVAPEPPVITAETIGELLKILPWIWLAGAAAVLIVNATCHFLAVRALKRNTESVCDKEITDMLECIKTEMSIIKPVEIRRGECVKTPSLCGFFKTVLYLPAADFRSDELSAILMHELTHYKRRDLWAKLFFLMVRAVHWFNPMVWLLAGIAEFNMELACDDEVLDGKTNDFRRNYGYLILLVAVSGGSRDVLTTKFCGGKKQMKKRFENIAKSKNSISGKALIAVGMAVMIGLGLFVGCKRAEPELALLPENSDTERYQKLSYDEDVPADESVRAAHREISTVKFPYNGVAEEFYYKDRVSGNIGFNGELIKIDGNKITLRGDKNEEFTFTYDDYTIINAPGGFKIGQQLQVFADDSLAKTICLKIDVSVNRSELTVSPPTNVEMVSAPFGKINGTDHKGIDITSSDGDNGLIFASVDGGVVMSKWNKGYGFSVIISDGQYTYLYAHCSKLYVNEGDSVKAGQVIGAIGSTGNAVGPHLHYEVRYNGSNIDPTPFLGEIPATPSERINTTDIKTLPDIETLNILSGKFAKAYFTDDIKTVEGLIAGYKSETPAKTCGENIWESLIDKRMSLEFSDSENAVSTVWYKVNGKETYSCLVLNFCRTGDSWTVKSFEALETEYENISKLYVAADAN